MRLTDFDALTFDLIGTLIDFEAGVLDWMRPRILKERPACADGEILESYARAQSAVRTAEPTLLFSQRLPRTWADVASEFGVEVGPKDGDRLVASARRWPAFPDSAEALAYLKNHFRFLVLVTNADRASARAMAANLGSPFSAIITEEEVGAGKPDPRVFEYFTDHLARLGVPRNRVLHVAQSQYHDIGPARRLGLATAWIYRRHGKAGYGGTPAPESYTKPDFLALSLGDLARQYEAALME
ncbi:MAG: HAD-IA family hydrolase [Alphaproteobacteria bacterium]